MRPTGDARDELVEELLEKERAIAKAREEMKTRTKTVRDRIKGLEDRRAELLDLLEGKEHVQPPLPLGRGPGLSIALAEQGAAIPKSEVKAAKEELARKSRAKRNGPEAP